MNLADKIDLGEKAIDLFQLIFKHYDLRHAEAVIYQCEERPHFDEAKKKNPRAKRSVASALQHTPDFSEPHIDIQSLFDFQEVRQTMSNLKQFDPLSREIASYVDKNDQSRTIIHEALKIVSRVRTTEGYFHIPLLDLDIPVEEGAPASIEEVAKNLGISSGAVLDSGRSYHFWGLQLLTVEDWYRFMYRALLLDRIDRRWVGHRLIDGQANLRISEKRGKVPVVVHVF